MNMIPTVQISIIGWGKYQGNMIRNHLLSNSVPLYLSQERKGKGAVYLRLYKMMFFWIWPVSVPG